MKYFTPGELSIFWLVLAALCAIVPISVLGRALEGDNFIPEDNEFPADENNEETDLENNFTVSEDDLYNIVQIVEMYLNDKDRRPIARALSSKYGTSNFWNRPLEPISNGFGGFPGKRSSMYDAIANDYYARAALKRSAKFGLRNALANKNKRYFNPVDTAGGSLFGPGIVTGTG